MVAACCTVVPCPTCTWWWQDINHTDNSTTTLLRSVIVIVAADLSGVPRPGAMLAAHLLAVRCCPAHVLAAAAVRVSALLHVPQLDNAVSVSSRHHLICGNSSSSGVGSQPQQRRCSARRQLHSMPASLPDVAPAASRRLVLALLQVCQQL